MEVMTGGAQFPSNKRNTTRYPHVGETMAWYIRYQATLPQGGEGMDECDGADTAIRIGITIPGPGLH